MRTLGLILFVLFVVVVSSDVHAQKASNVVICKKTSSGAITLRTRKCVSGEVKISNISSLTGAGGANGTNGTNGTNGANGANGADGSLRIYGDGSAGELHVTSNTILTDPNLQYTNVLIDVGVQLDVPGGTVLRVNGTFRNRGTILVGAQGDGTYTDSNTVSGLTDIARNSPAAAYVARVATNGEYGPSSLNLVGGNGGYPYGSPALRSILKPGVFGGGPGAGSGRSTQGEAGGGSLTILVADYLSNEGLISADGVSTSGGAGGGAGGIIIMASRTSISNTGTITAIGGNGGSSTTSCGAGGGGGGGIVHLLAPRVTAGTITLTGGAAGSTSTAVSASFRAAGGGGGACGGYGGYGSDVNASPGNNQSGALAGGVGTSFTTLADPTGLF